MVILYIQCCRETVQVYMETVEKRAEVQGPVGDEAVQDEGN